MSRPLSLFALAVSIAACGGTNPVDPAPSSADVEATPGVILEGTVRRFTTDQLLGGVVVVADQSEATSTDKGSYAFTGLAEGEVEIRASYPGFLTYVAKQRLQPGRNRHDIDLVPERQR